MTSERIYQKKVAKVSQQQKQQSFGTSLPDNRPEAIMQARLCDAIQCKGVIQRGGIEYVPHAGRTLLEKGPEKEGKRMFYTQAGTHYYVELYEQEGWLGEVVIDASAYPDRLALHTNSSEEGGAAPFMFNEAIRRVKEDFPDVQSVQLGPAPGAASKKVIEMLSGMFGDPELHAQAEGLQIVRVERDKARKEQEKQAAKTGQAIVPGRKYGLNEWNPEMLDEHKLHLQALVANRAMYPSLSLMTPCGLLMGQDLTGAGIAANPDQMLNYIKTRPRPAGYQITMENEVLRKFMGKDDPDTPK